MIRKGFFTSIRPGQGSILLNINTTTSAFYASINLETWMRLYWKNADPDEVEFRKVLKDVRVTFDLHGESSRKWIICGVSKHKVNDTKFEKHKPGTSETETWSVHDHMLNSKRSAFLNFLPLLIISLAYPYSKYQARFNRTATCINVGSQSKKTWLPADKLTIVDWQIFRKVLSPDRAEEMVKAAERTPHQNKILIQNTALPLLGLTSKPSVSFYQVVTSHPLQQKLFAN
jgi:hypothetical protein